MIIVGKELGKLATSKAMEWYVKKIHEKSEVKKDGSILIRKKINEIYFIQARYHIVSANTNTI